MHHHVVNQCRRIDEVLAPPIRDRVDSYYDRIRAISANDAGRIADMRTATFVAFLRQAASAGDQSGWCPPKYPM